MLRIVLGTTRELLNKVASKLATKALKDAGVSAKAEINDLVIYGEGDELIVHVSGDLRIKEEELLNFLNNKMDAAE